MKTLNVIYQGLGERIVLGTLADDGRDVLFQYSPQAIERGLELSPLRMPLRALAYPDHQAHLVSVHRVPGLIFDSLPDSWGFRLMARRMRARGIDPETVSTLDRLAYLGDNTMGALTYEPATQDLKDAHDLTLVELATEIQALVLDEGHQVLDEIARTASSPGGARPKATVFYDARSARMSTRAGYVHSAEPWLVKFPAAQDEPDACALEALYAQIAHRCDMGMAATQFFEISKTLSAFGTQRFDRHDGQRVHVHSLAGLLHLNFNIPSLGYEDFFRATRRLTRDHSEVKKAVKLCVYNVLMNNRDDHSKNFAFRYTLHGEWQLAPPYDLTYCVGAGGEHFMDVAGEAKAPGRAHIVQAAKGAGLETKETEALIDQILDCATHETFKSLSREFPLRRKTVATVSKVIELNRSRLLKR